VILSPVTRRKPLASPLALARAGSHVSSMQKDVVEVSVKGVMPTANGCAVFLGNEEKTFVIYVDHSVGNAIQMTINGVKKDRPLTHDLIGHILLGLGAKLDYILINDVNEGTFFARILLRMENELGKKIIEIDARPSDSTVLALQHKRPIFAARKVFDAVEDMSEILERVLQQQAQETESDEDDEEDDDDEDIAGESEEGTEDEGDEDDDEKKK
jgi:bifunctional DNase/RNase